MREPIHPGETLREDLAALGMTRGELARRIKVPVNRITQLLNGQRAVTGDTALRLGRFFGTSGEFWLNLQKLYELRACGARERRGDRPAAHPGRRKGPAGFPSDWSIAVAKLSRNGVSPGPAVNSLSSAATGRPIPTISAPAPPVNRRIRSRVLPGSSAVAGYSSRDVGSPSDAVAPRANA